MIEFDDCFCFIYLCIGEFLSFYIPFATIKTWKESEGNIVFHLSQKRDSAEILFLYSIAKKGVQYDTVYSIPLISCLVQFALSFLKTGFLSKQK